MNVKKKFSMSCANNRRHIHVKNVGVSKLTKTTQLTDDNYNDLQKIVLTAQI